MKTLAITTLAIFCLLAAAPGARAADGLFSFTVGDAHITAIQDASGEMPLSIFHGAPESEMKQLAPSGSVPAGVTVFLIQFGEKNILVDAGYGPGKGALLSLLAQMDLKPADIDMILLTHMHGDHIGGLLDNGNAMYPKAKIVVSADELEYWTKNAAPEFAETARKAIMVRDAYADRIETHNYIPVTSEVRAIALVGHTPGHTAYLFSSKGKEMLFWGDTIHGAALQFPNPEICAKYDMDPEKAVASRRAAMDMAVSGAAMEPVPVAGAHLPFPAVGRVERDGNAFRFIPGL